jgi:hypothetical protein
MHLVEHASPRGNVALVGDAIILRAVHLLVRAHRLAAHAHADAWDFAVEIGEFHRSGVTASELRWLVTRGYARHGEELAPGAAGRRFRLGSTLGLTSRSCFVLTEAGLSIVQSAVSISLPAANGPVAPVSMAGPRAEQLPPAPSPTKASPVWEPCRSELRVGSYLVKRFRCPAPNQQAILEAFERAGWPSRVDDPLPPAAEQCPKRRLHDAIKCLNRRQVHAVLRFFGDGSGKGVLWELVA